MDGKKRQEKKRAKKFSFHEYEIEKGKHIDLRTREKKIRILVKNFLKLKEIKYDEIHENILN